MDMVKKVVSVKQELSGGEIDFQETNDKKVDTSE
jgi:hypothetical protein